MKELFVALSETGWVAIIVACVGLVGVLGNSVIGLLSRKEVKRTRNEVTDLANVNSADHGLVARALSALTETVNDHNRRTGERFQRLGERMGELAARQEKTNERIDDVMNSQLHHLQQHADSKQPPGGSTEQ